MNHPNAFAAPSAVLLGMLTACGPDVPRGTFTQDNNNERFDITVASVGDPVIRATAPVDVEFFRDDSDEVVEPRLSFGDATVVTDPATGYARTYVEVVNDGTRPLCFVHGETIEFLDADDILIGADGTYVDGAVARTASAGLLTGTCILEDGQAFLAAITEDVNAMEVARIRIRAAATDAWAFDAPDAEVVPTSVEFQEVEDEPRLSIALKNVGSASATLETSTVVFFDEDGEFLYWEFALDAMPGEVGPGETSVMDVSLMRVPGTPAEVVVHVGWDE